MLTVLAPAKLNLTLEVLAKRQDGFHEIRSVLQTISLCDRLSFDLGDNLGFKSDLPEWIPEESLVSKAARLVQKIGGTKGATIIVNKHIPLLSGLGGDSSDAAATLRGLNQLWGLELSHGELLKLAEQLGSDVAFFLHGGTALVEGRGELVTSLSPLPHQWVVLLIPPVPRGLGKTKQLYESLQAERYTDGRITAKLVRELEAGGEFTPSSLFNTFENIAFTHFSELSIYREHMLKIGTTHIHLAGSGPALFTLVEEKPEAGELYLRLQKAGLAAYLAETLETIEMD